jgi:hypothetical protein
MVIALIVAVAMLLAWHAGANLVLPVVDALAQVMGR